jgi:hypothetical protein
MFTLYRIIATKMLTMNGLHHAYAHNPVIINVLTTP